MGLFDESTGGTTQNSQGSGAATTPQAPAENGGGVATGGTASGQPAAAPVATGEKTWYDSLPEDLSKEPSIRLHKDIQSLAKSYLSAQKMIGQDKLVVPGKNSTDEDWANFYKKIGVPDVDKYDVKVAVGDVKLNDALLGKLKEVAQKSGLLPKQFENVATAFVKEQLADMKASQEKAALEKNAGIESLKKEWGQDWDKNIVVGKAAIKEFMPPEVKKYFDEKGISDDPMFARFLVKVGKSLAEDKIRGEAGVKFGLTKDDAQKEYMALTNDLNGPYYTGSHPNHAAAVEQARRLYEIINGA